MPVQILLLHIAVHCVQVAGTVSFGSLCILPITLSADPANKEAEQLHSKRVASRPLQQADPATPHQDRDGAEADRSSREGYRLCDLGVPLLRQDPERDQILDQLPAELADERVETGEDLG